MKENVEAMDVIRLNNIAS